MNKTANVFALFLAFLVTGAVPPGRAQSEPALQSSAPDVPAQVREKIAALSSPDPIARAAAACALGRMQMRAVAAIPNLVALLSDGSLIAPQQSCGQQEPFEDEQWQPRYAQVYEPSPGEAATHALMAIGEPGWNALKEVLLRDEHWRARKNAAWGLAHRGQAVEQLMTALQDSAWQVRSQAAYALFQRGGDSRPVMAALIAHLQDPAWQVREQAAMALGQKGSSGEDLFTPLMAALKDANAQVRGQVASALGFSAGDREVDLLIAARNDPDRRVRAGVRRALDMIKQRMKGTTTNLRVRKIPE